MRPQQAGSVRNNIVTINVEDYFQVGAFSQLIPFEHWDRFDTRVRRNTEKTLELLESKSTHATFFASGWIGENYPDIVNAIIDAGHEIACQGYYQQSIRNISPRAFREDLRRSRQAIEDATGRAVWGFRVGRGRIGPDDLWALDILAEENFRYDASICPIGRQFAKQEKRFALHRYPSHDSDFWLVPASAVTKFGWAIPFSGGNYVRQLPEWLTRETAARWVERRHAPLVMYFHVWELDTGQPVISAANWVQRIRHYRNLAHMPDRIAYFLSQYPFTSISHYLGLEQSSATPTRETVEIVSAPLVQDATSDTTPARDITVVVPCYNEEASLSYLAKALDHFIAASAAKLALRFVFVDDGSSDSTLEKLHQYFGKLPYAEIVSHRENRGIAGAITTGFRHTTTDLVAVIDADCTFDPMQLLEMVPLMLDDIDVVTASPLHNAGAAANVPAWRMALSNGAAFLYRSVLRHKLTSYTSCFRIYRLSVVRELAVYSPGFCGVAEILARLDLAGHRIVECPANLETRLLGQSKINLFKTIFEHIKLITRIAAAKWLNIALPDGHQYR